MSKFTKNKICKLWILNALSGQHVGRKKFSACLPTGKPGRTYGAEINKTLFFTDLLLLPVHGFVVPPSLNDIA